MKKRGYDPKQLRVKIGIFFISQIDYVAINAIKLLIRLYYKEMFFGYFLMSGDD
tara:strand:+ start:281 stop:442 length:162 start_codon:yes stop_codon:yes gene_type:complete